MIPRVRLRRAVTLAAAALAFAAGRAGALALAGEDPERGRIEIVVVAPPRSRALLEAGIAPLLAADRRIAWTFRGASAGDGPRIRIEPDDDEHIVITIYPAEGTPAVRSIDAPVLKPVTVEVVAQIVRETARELSAPVTVTVARAAPAPSADPAWQVGLGAVTRVLYGDGTEYGLGPRSHGIGGTLTRFGSGSTFRPLVSLALEGSRLGGLYPNPSVDLIATRMSGGVVWSPATACHVAASVGAGWDAFFIDGGTYQNQATTFAARGQLALSLDVPLPGFTGDDRPLSVTAATSVDLEPKTALFFQGMSHTRRVQPGATIGLAWRL